MSLEKKPGSPYWYTRFCIRGVRIQESTKTTNKAEARRYEDMRRQQIRNQVLFKTEKPKTWIQAVERWTKEMTYKRTWKQDVSKFSFINQYLGKYNLEDIKPDIIYELVYKKESEGARPATINRYLALIKAILNKAYKEWGWLNKTPYIKLRPENNERIRWLNEEEINKLMKELPPHLMLMAKFSLLTGQRESNVCRMKWKDIDFISRIWIIPGHIFKNGETHVVPLNKAALNLLESCRINNNSEYVFIYQGKPVRRGNTKAFRNALKRAGIDNFRWHDFRHTWATKHRKKGTDLQQLKELGGWKSYNMTLRYGHIDREKLFEAAEKITEEDV